MLSIFQFALLQNKSLTVKNYSYRHIFFIFRDLKVQGILRRISLTILNHWLFPQVGWVKLNSDSMAQGVPSKTTARGVFKITRNLSLGLNYCFNIGVCMTFFAKISIVIWVEYAHQCNCHRLWTELDYMVIIQFLQSSSYLSLGELPRDSITASNLSLICVSTTPISIKSETPLQVVWRRCWLGPPNTYEA